jgi:hypothetical protein
MPQKPSETEEEYFARREYEQRRDLAEKRAAAMAVEEKQRLRDLHYLHCPKDGMDLITVALQGVQVDRCATCGGMWLDAGEMEELTKREQQGPLGRLLRIFTPAD